jgi:MFS family permease
MVDTALVTFSLWIGIICAQVWGFLLNDRIPLLLVRRRGGNWKPEYRLYSLVIPSVIIMPAGLGIFGAALQYHLHYVLLALGSFMVTFASMVSVPIAVNYLTECFRSYPTEVSAIMGLYRLVLGLAVPFFIDQWMLAVDGPGWVFGMEAFFSLMVFCLIVLLMWQGENIRRMSSRFRGSDEDGVQVISVGVH